MDIRNGWCIMRILVLSDSHSSMSFMRKCVNIIEPETVVHLGDYFEDGLKLSREYPRVMFHQVPGNCDLFRFTGNAPLKLCYPVGGVKLYMVHGHEQGVKSGIQQLIQEARVNGAKAALYGHTHVPDCHQEADGLWVLNPGSSRSGTAGYLETENGEITLCKIITQEDLEEFL